MTPWLARGVRFFGTLTGRMAMTLATGVVIALVASILIAERGRQAEYDRGREERVVASALDVIKRLNHAPDGMIANLRDGRLIGAQLLQGASIPTATPDDEMTRKLAMRATPASRPTIARVPGMACLGGDPFWTRPRAAGFDAPLAPDCWLLAVRVQGRPVAIALALPHLPAPPSWTTDWRFLLLVFTAAFILSLIVARVATAPLRRLSAAAEAFARSIDAEPVTERGPSDVRAALATFNLMQERVRAGLRERTRILAAISHDLQTPLTRLRLRLEQVEDEALRERLVADLSATLSMVKRGLDLARSGESGEDWSSVDIDSLLSSLADDAAEFGHAVCFTQGCGSLVRARPDSLNRCLSNLIDNAIKYGGNAEIAARRAGKVVIITVRDHGPGMTETMLAHAFDPFVRADTSRSSADGTGIGLTIARAQAAATGAILSLDNHPDGGLEATLTVTRS